MLHRPCSPATSRACSAPQADLDELDGLVANRLEAARRAASASGSRRARFLGLLNRKKQRLKTLLHALEDDFAGVNRHSEGEGDDSSGEEEFEFGPAALPAAAGSAAAAGPSTSLPSQQQQPPPPGDAGEKKKQRKRKGLGGDNTDLLG